MINSRVDTAPRKVAPGPSRNWGVGVGTLAAGQFLSVMGYSLMVPFLPLYLQELGVRDAAALTLWSGVTIGVAPLAAGVAAPFWGAIGDRFGIKPMAIRALAGGGLAVLLMAFVPNPWALLALRLLQGVAGGQIAPNTALAAAIAPPGRLGTSLGLVQAGVLTGSSFGPVIGGL
ncbi:MAG: MFS transporter, partial [Dehalococcoidia bacterium]|nr:MFS transporter [Dehalococcoidia bacterium]